jgi:uncharacterized sulfatase
VSDAGEHVNRALQAADQGTVARLQRLLASTQPSALSTQPARLTPAPASGRSGGALNVLLITVDDLNTRLGCYGHEVQTPGVDRLARQGRRFEHAYAQFPSCNPSRVSLMTGWRPERSGVWSNLQPPRPQLPGAVPMQEHFRARGYFTARVGKVYHGPFEEQFRWDVSENTPQPDTDDDEPSERGHGMASWWRPTENADGDEPDGRTVRRVARLLAASRQRPFFIAAGLHKPHLRWVAPRRYFDLYPPERVRWPPEPADDWADVPEIAIARRAPRFPGAFLAGRLEPDDLRAQAIAAYQASVSFMDAQVGVLLETLDRLKLWPRTVVVFTSDHGFHLGEHGGLWRKNTLFEESVRVPLIVAAPGMEQPGRPSLRMVELVDLYPTLVELAGVAPPDTPLDGRSMAPLLRDPAAAFDEAAFSMTERVPPEYGRSLRTERWRYTLWPNGADELYDHRADPRETRNLAADAAHAATVRDLRAALARAVQ